MVKRDSTGLQSLGQILKNYNLVEKKYISKEFQDYGYRLAMELQDEKHKALYIKMAKELPRHILEQARTFIKDASNVRSKGRLFMWKVRELKKKAFK